MRLIRRSGLTQSQVSRDLGVSTFTLRSRLQQAEIDSGERGGLTMDERDQLCRLRRENKVLREEREIAAEGGGAHRTDDRAASMKYRLIDAEKPRHSVLRLARTLVELVEAIHEDSRDIYGAPRVRAELADDHAICVGKKRAAWLCVVLATPAWPLSAGPGASPAAWRRRTSRAGTSRRRPPTSSHMADITYVSAWEGCYSSSAW